MPHNMVHVRVDQRGNPMPRQRQTLELTRMGRRGPAKYHCVVSRRHSCLHVDYSVSLRHSLIWQQLILVQTLWNCLWLHLTFNMLSGGGGAPMFTEMHRKEAWLVRVRSAAARVLLSMTTLVHTLSYCARPVTVCTKGWISISSLLSCLS